jgi:hypothetical protein
VRRILLIVALVLAASAISIYAQGPFTAQITNALRVYLAQSHVWTGPQTFSDISITGACNGCNSSDVLHVFVNGTSQTLRPDLSFIGANFVGSDDNVNGRTVVTLVPGGNQWDVQFKNSVAGGGGFAGNDAFTWNNDTLTLGLGAASPLTFGAAPATHGAIRWSRHTDGSLYEGIWMAAEAGDPWRVLATRTLAGLNSVLIGTPTGVLDEAWLSGAEGMEVDLAMGGDFTRSAANALGFFGFGNSSSSSYSAGVLLFGRSLTETGPNQTWFGDTVNSVFITGAGSLALSTPDVTGSANAALLSLKGGGSVNGNAGSVDITSGIASGMGTSAPIRLFAGDNTYILSGPAYAFIRPPNDFASFIALYGAAGVSSAIPGGDVYIHAGAATLNASGGAYYALGGLGEGTGNTAGLGQLGGGHGTNGATGGDAQLVGGNADGAATAGNALIAAGTSDMGTNGNIVLTTVGNVTINGTPGVTATGFVKGLRTGLLTLPTSTVIALPTCNGGAEGQVRGVTDALLPAALAAVATGGLVHVPVYCNGTAWIVF